MARETQPSGLERLRGAVARRIDRLPGAVRVALSGQRSARADGVALDPTLQLAVALRPSADRTHDAIHNPNKSRARFRREILSTVGTPTPIAQVRGLTVDGASGPLRARLYRPEAGPRPMLVYFHGGGYVEGDLDTADEGCRILAVESGHQVLSVEYRLAPEHPAPAGIEDAVAAFRWAQVHAAGLDATSVSVGGDSAGAALAAVVAQETSDDRPPAGQLLIYPPTDVPTPYPSRRQFDGYLLTEAQRVAYHRAYTMGSDLGPADPRISPLYGRLDGLAPALVVTAGFDVLRDEVDAYAAALDLAGTSVTHLRYPSLPHGFANVTALSRASRSALAEVARQWRAVVPA